MALENLQKVADVLLKGVAATAIAAGGLYVSLNKNRLDQGSVCLNMSEKLYAPMDDSLSLERKQHRLGLLIDKYNETCTELSASETDFLMNSLAPIQIAAAAGPAIFPTPDPAPPSEPPTIRFRRRTSMLPNSDPSDQMIIANPQADLGNTGWVAVGRVGGTYGQINFDNAESLLVHPLPSSVKKILKARWSVNVRTNTSNTQLGANPLKATLDAGDCVESSALQEVRGQVWTNAKVVNCPI